MNTRGIEGEIPGVCTAVFSRPSGFWYPISLITKLGNERYHLVRCAHVPGNGVRKNVRADITAFEVGRRKFQALYVYTPLLHFLLIDTTLQGMSLRKEHVCVHGVEQRFGCIHVGNAIQVYGTPTSLADTTAHPHPLLSSQWQHSHCKSHSYYGNCVPVSKNVLVVTPTANIQWTAGFVRTWSSDQTDELSWQILSLLSHRLYTRASSYFHTSHERMQSSRHNF